MAYMRYFDKYSQADNQRVFTNQRQWFIGKLRFDNYTMDFEAAGQQISQIKLFPDVTTHSNYRYSCVVTNMNVKSTDISTVPYL